ncbi:hypothetical protein Halhy_2524 [Haliscomenobacter hydrossis DSM 1100]|uniref:Uncharacterized protein n=1 Tax=Haliscomenobacter hydrossis (strain ATCC 27775 / DSM 1100 / LMG 10767 / O) TaxID=760192 RepID=F4KYJ1_HALH1|nr:hypothetical protein Halhy_2524 [Haliscomenobacter hydrossis DSM 1100]
MGDPAWSPFSLAVAHSVVAITNAHIEGDHIGIAPTVYF